MDEMRLNQRQLGVFRGLINEAQNAKTVLDAAQGKVGAFYESIKAQFDIPDLVESLKIHDDGLIEFTVPAPTSELPPHPMIEAAKAMIGASAAAGSGLSLVEPSVDVTAEPAG